MNKGQIRWEEVRDLGRDDQVLIYMIAEKTSEGWKIFEKENGEIRWYPAPMTKERRNRLDVESKGQEQLTENSIRSIA